RQLPLTHPERACQPSSSLASCCSALVVFPGESGFVDPNSRRELGLRRPFGGWQRRNPSAGSPRPAKVPVRESLMFSIFRSKKALTHLKRAWEQADDRLRQAILDASRRVDDQLHTDPHEQGESRDGATRILFEAPVGVIFEVDEDKKLVRV